MKQLNINSDPILLEIFNRISSLIHPKKMILFGSQATGASGVNSDYDVMIIVENSSVSKLHLTQSAYEALWGIEKAVDIIIYSEEEFSSQKDEINSLAYRVANEGLELLVG